MLNQKNIVFLCDECIEDAKERMKDRKEDKTDRATQTGTSETSSKDTDRGRPGWGHSDCTPRNPSRTRSCRRRE
ncbi:hypothetical protein E2C01_102194 [Portunus trituberculatus]|uniref:Uncharacterized protein n=1 Tax=Portunus trituberculatus TaxID=210409 RepID=A0A5B7KNM7_PORTR|nr:hypothetical protein [Portunus trituberculatus]